MQNDLPTASSIRFSAMGLLALREHSVKELKDKLARKFPCVESVDAAVSELVQQNLQSDERFTQAFVAMRQRQGKGPLIIKMELRDKGIAAELVTQYVHDADPLWTDLARGVRQRKFREPIPSDQRERAKQMRFLNSRGFSGQQIRSALTDLGADDS